MLSLRTVVRIKRYPSRLPSSRKNPFCILIILFSRVSRTKQKTNDQFELHGWLLAIIVKRQEEGSTNTKPMGHIKNWTERVNDEFALPVLDFHIEWLYSL